jgi:hypothetical protein
MTFIYLHDANSHAVLASTAFDPLVNRMPWITQVMCGYHECEPDAVGYIETDDGEFVTVKGARAAYVARN